MSKLLTKILASRIAGAFEDAGVIDTQNSFRRDLCCTDNIFSLNALLSLNRDKKRLASLMFVDLQEAYDRVDRGILLKKIKQMNFSPRLLAYLKDYYSGDCVVTDAVGVRLTQQYQSRGLRQGCNLSSILFSNICVRARKQATEVSFGNRKARWESSSLLYVCR